MLPSLGFTEIVLIGLVAMLVLKPADLPALMHKMGLWSATWRQNMQGMWQGWLEQSGSQAGPQAGPVKIPQKPKP